MQNFDRELKDKKDALDQYSALTHIVLDMLESKKRECKMFFVALLCSLFVNVIIVVGFLYCESQWEYSDTVTTTTEQEVSDTVTTTTEQEVSGTDSEINNVEGDQYKDTSVHNDEREK